MQKKRFFKILAFEILAIIAIALFFFVDASDIYKFYAGDTVFATQNEDCDLHVSACGVKLSVTENEMFFDIEPKSIPLMQELHFEVKLAKPLSKDTLDLAIYATNMNMGYHTVAMQKITENTYAAKAILPTCSVGGMQWRAEVKIDAPTKSYGGAFHFKTE
ncbi:MAG: hypothetical protein IBX44_02125 [Sulfurospirillum sp.]|nr:hypothetical protein [Sulfurospirillum sp.]